jgi:hypothetical protein
MLTNDSAAQAHSLIIGSLKLRSGISNSPIAMLAPHLDPAEIWLLCDGHWVVRTQASATELQK